MKKVKRAAVKETLNRQERCWQMQPGGFIGQLRAQQGATLGFLVDTTFTLYYIYLMGSCSCPVNNVAGGQSTETAVCPIYIPIFSRSFHSYTALASLLLVYYRPDR